jgi:hypothetical protein
MARLIRAKTKTVSRKKGTKMSEQIEVSKQDMKNEGVLEIRGEQGSTGKLEVFFRHPVLADIVEKMGMGNYPAADFDKIYKPILMAYPDPKATGRVVSRPSVYNATKNIEGGTDFSFSSPPRGVLIANPAALRAGFSLVVELTAPVPHDTLRKWGKQLMDGCADIIAASRPFKMSWVMTESALPKV